MTVPEVSISEVPLFDSSSSTFSFLNENKRKVLMNELPGQLYAYRYDDTRLALGTRRQDVFGAAIGIEVIANGSYQCFASNGNANAAAMLDINVKGTDLY